MLKIAICEDEEEHKNLLVELINRFEFGSDYLLTAFKFGKDLIAEYHNGNRYDIIFLDMHLENEDGIDVANEIRKKDEKTQIVITTSLIEYAILGYSVNASDFLLKPLSQEKVDLILNKMVQKKKKLAANFHEIEINNEKVILRTDEILYFESIGRKIKVVTTDGSYDYYYTISALVRDLDPTQFILCHRSYIINLKNVRRIKKGLAVIKKGVEIPISVKKYQLVYDAFTKYLSEEIR
ncbi:LytR/AlgR family response regulator transcription factor [Acetobacterium woodii]|uniref:Stage 0 sporulation protein A homolog n=1 Tax=Acetobacterium woodii (strain ATCC 29683 / DSM 1030 / JCM 2381 / KCTC 1655 / WB1) TaxID=931626 RepID=H6LHB3_ACEWD|nr:LytTR family DNA-binding domain-containing protein [Acetobacterium woodii]AFA48451.1 two component transcriptional regulator LytTR family [Acetobacterium woodii DSM 1030]